ncbi:hypothetical protein ACJRO7_006230 [Eucalyptus globulus]|uniref:Pentatricopeptide repeat-containing protein n=1 Tax=Eucalyptus globulus TaxID=34317 RepID=A0ABD3II49_EUCGL
MSSASGRRCLLLLEKCKTMRHLREAHGQVITCGLGSNSFALSRLLAFCADPRHGSVHYAWELFRRIQMPTICICNTIIKAFLLNNEFFSTVSLYNRLLMRGFCPDNYTIPYVLKACAKLHDHYLGESVHGHGIKVGLLSDIFVGNSLISMYCEHKSMRAARKAFDEIPRRCVISWTIMISAYAKLGDVDSARVLFDEVTEKDKGIWGAMISGYVQNGCVKEGLYMFRLMQLNGVEPDESVLVSTLSACAHLGALDIGIWIHRYVNRWRLTLSSRLCTGLIDMYAKCGYIDIAKKLFDEMPEKDNICWNAMISGYAFNGDGESALKLFTEMENGSIQPDDITFISIFTACNHSGLPREGLRLLYKMLTEYNIEPKSEHYGCLVDLLCQAGFLEEAKEILLKFPGSGPFEEAIAWRALLQACCKQGNSQMAEFAAERLVQLECHSGAYVLLSNLYAVAAKQDEVRRVRKLMTSRGVYKAPGCSSIQLNGGVYEFIAGEKTHPHMDRIYSTLDKLNKQLDC